MKSRDESSAPIPDQARGLWRESGVSVGFDTYQITTFACPRMQYHFVIGPTIVKGLGGSPPNPPCTGICERVRGRYIDDD